jgi:hypothetical protein
MKDDLTWLLTDNVGYFYKKPTYRSKKSTFLYNAYAKSGLNELWWYIHSHSGENTIKKVENFRHDVDTFSCIAKNPETSYMFSVYYDVATQALDLMLSYLENKKGGMTYCVGDQKTKKSSSMD